MDPSILVSNIRGAASGRGRRYMKEMMGKFKPSIIIVLETRVQYHGVGKYWEKLGLQRIAVEEARGFSGSIWVFGRDNSITCSILESSTQTITLSFDNGSAELMCTAVYASPIPNIRASLWGHLKSLRLFWVILMK